MPESQKEQLARGLNILAEQGMPTISDHLHEPLLRLVELIHKWGRVHNLTAVRDKSQMVDRHLLDSLIMSRWLNASSSVEEGVSDVMDIGSGAGLPVLPLAIIRPDLSFVSVESNGKKMRFQQQALLELKLSNVLLLHNRVENVSHKAHLVMSRAFTAPDAFLRIASSLCTASGRVAIMLGQADRFPELVAPDYQLEELVQLDVPGTESARHVAVCRRQ